MINMNNNKNTQEKNNIRTRNNFFIFTPENISYEAKKIISDGELLLQSNNLPYHGLFHIKYMYSALTGLFNSALQNGEVDNTIELNVLKQHYESLLIAVAWHDVIQGKNAESGENEKKSYKKLSAVLKNSGISKNERNIQRNAILSTGYTLSVEDGTIIQDLQTDDMIIKIFADADLGFTAAPWETFKKGLCLLSEELYGEFSESNKEFKQFLNFNAKLLTNLEYNSPAGRRIWTRRKVNNLLRLNNYLTGDNYTIFFSEKHS